MQKPLNNPDDPSPERILSFHQIEQLSDDEILSRVALRLGQIQKAFIEVGKLAVVWKQRHGDQAFIKLQRRLKLKKTSIDNARHTARVWEEYVANGHLTEERFEALTFRQVLQLKKQLRSNGPSEQAVELAMQRCDETNDSSACGAEFEEYVLTLLRATYPTLAWTCPGKAKRHERGLDFIGASHDPTTGIVRRVGVQAKYHASDRAPAELEWLQFLGGCFVQGVSESIFITTGRLTSQQQRDAGEGKIYAVVGRDEIDGLARRCGLPACPDF